MGDSLPPLEAHHGGVGGLDYVAIAIWVVLVIITLFMFYQLARSATKVKEGMGQVSEDINRLTLESERINSLLREV